jgi:hypothetical protein
MSRRCTICSHPATAKLVGQMIKAELPDVEIARRTGTGRMSVARHRVGHLLPASAVAQVASVLDHASEHDLEASTAESPGSFSGADESPDSSTTAWQDRLPPIEVGGTSPRALAQSLFGLPASARRLTRLQGRLESAMGKAEAAGSATALAQLSAQMLRSIELGARLAELPGIIPSRENATGSHGTPFSVTFSFAGSEPFAVRPHQPIIEGFVEADPGDEGTR